MLPLPGNAVHDRQQDSRKDEGNLNSYAPFELAIACLIDIHKTLQQVDGRNGDNRSQELNLEIPKADMTHPGWLVFLIVEFEARYEVLVAAEHHDQH